MANGRLAAKLDLRALAGQPDIYGIGPIEQLRGEVTIINGHSVQPRGIFERSVHGPFESITIRQEGQTEHD